MRYLGYLLPYSMGCNIGSPFIGRAFDDNVDNKWVICYLKGNILPIFGGENAIK